MAFYMQKIAFRGTMNFFLQILWNLIFQSIHTINYNCTLTDKLAVQWLHNVHVRVSGLTVQDIQAEGPQKVF